MIKVAENRAARLPRASRCPLTIERPVQCLRHRRSLRMSPMTTPIVDFVRQYAQSGTSRLHMPGHKGQPFLGCEAWDITEIKGADELYEAEGIIARSEANATALFGTARTYYSTEGSSQCIRAMLALALQGAPKTGKRPVLLAARNAHKALLYATALLDFDIQWPAGPGSIRGRCGAAR